MNERRSELGPQEYQDTLKEVREKRYEQIRVTNGKEIARYAQLDNEQWERLDENDKLDLIEFFNNAHAEILRWRSPLHESIEATAEHRRKMKDAEQQFASSIQDVVQAHKTRVGAELNEENSADIKLRRQLDDIRNEFTLTLEQSKGFTPYERERKTNEAFKRILDDVDKGKDADDIVSELHSITQEVAAPRPNDENLFPIHDGIHVLEKYAKTGGFDEPTVFADRSILDQEPTESEMQELITKMYLEELYPFLFEPTSLYEDASPLIPTLLQTPELRSAKMTEVENKLDETEPGSVQHAILSDLLETLQTTPTTTQERIKDYEKFALGTLLTTASQVDSKETYETVKDAFWNLNDESRPQHYKEFANRVFSDKEKEDPRIYVDEMLRVIHQTPKETN